MTLPKRGGRVRQLKFSSSLWNAWLNRTEREQLQIDHLAKGIHLFRVQLEQKIK